MWPISTKAQIHSKNLRTIELSMGLMDKLSFKKDDNVGIWLNFIFSKYNARKGGFRYGINLQQKYYETPVKRLINVNQYFVETGYGFELIKSKKRRLFLNGVGGLVAGYESINGEKKEVDALFVVQNESKILAGTYFLVEFEAILSTKTSLIINTRQIWTPTSNLQDFHSRVGIGLRLNYF
ncbi:hypothetical protein Emtol_0330 (plasmid) [Emticicia oligotrophica DSM 17448]|uniref:Conjugative transposon protein TraO n=1 Tax=Emticicia oligotrophica (strain DSM 17448 / CIP 109782 / MTCC 6937 / GPTSA100-15) TaxID=929562 RepID=A0ABN4AUN5_EMTOG|nr:conjugal transfer protein TraO [Emticicia oligotrophica]AFK05597.1 hypothetical protein Emtol_0330 [Emticicia oligotrophica DSM 17448]